MAVTSYGLREMAQRQMQRQWDEEMKRKLMVPDTYCNPYHNSLNAAARAQAPTPNYTPTPAYLREELLCLL